MLENVRLRRKLAYFGQVVRGESLEKAVMLGMGGESRSRGRPRRRWWWKLPDCPFNICWKQLETEMDRGS